MEPVILSGSYCLLRFFVPGSRSGRTVLVEERKIAECAYTLKRYMRRPPPRDEPNALGRIFLESLHPDQLDILRLAEQAVAVAPTPYKSMVKCFAEAAGADHKI